MHISRFICRCRRCYFQIGMYMFFCICSLTQLYLFFLLYMYIILSISHLSYIHHPCITTNDQTENSIIPQKLNEFILYSTSLDAKHVQNKAARKANHNRPKKSRPSDINRKPVVYPSFEKPSEYTISDAPAAPVTKKSE